MVLDIETMVGVMALLGALAALGFAAMAPHRPRDGIRMWTLALATIALGWLVLRIDLQMVVAVRLFGPAAMILSGGFALMTLAFARFAERSLPPGFLAGPVLLGALGQWLSASEPALQIACANGVFALQRLQLVAVLWRMPDCGAPRIRVTLIACFGLAAALLVLRCAELLLHDGPLAPSGLRSAIESANFVVGVGAFVLGSFGLLVLHRERAEQALRQLATRDSLTELFNRRHFFELTERALAAAQRRQRPVALLMVDIDHFKRINDTHGHLVGDEVLRDFAQVAGAGLRTEDLVARFGGEEFVVLLPETSREAAWAAAERLRCAVELREVGAARVRYTVSIGLCTLAPATPLAEMLCCADRALYRAKAGGRNRSVASDESLIRAAFGR